MASRELKLVIFGATGFTGKLAAEYVSTTYGGDAGFSWGLAGRNAAKLEEVAASLPHRPTKVLVADAQDDAALSSLAAATEVVVTTAGPFARYGSKLVAACVRAGTHYSDITGEVDWVREMVAVHDAEAQRTGAMIVHLCGHDSIPWDLMTLMLWKKLGEELVRVDMYDKIKSAPSGGTLETAMGILFGKAPPRAPEVDQLGFDPMLRSRDGSKSSSLVLNRSPILEGLAPSRLFFFMAGVNCNAVKRSNALNGYGRRVEYAEGLAFPSIVHSVLMGAMFLCFGVILAFPPTRFLMKRFVLPKPGEGPTTASMKKGFLKVEGRATGVSGRTVKAKMTFSVDPGYLDTARMLVEAGLAMALDKKELTCGGGVFTAGACQGEVLLRRLCATGTTFEYLEDE